ncbi:MAG: UDP-N-acetylmuramate--L-alanine ligase [Acidimicrobiia bacterium]|nr:UDP-N-acetylmuramate--L-alanine ligase [Acidimicrobiia bacterium]
MPEITPVALDAPARIHIVGIGGVGMSAIAAVLIGMGHEVSGSDLKLSKPMERLSAQGVVCAVGHVEDNVAPDVDYVVASTAIGAGNPETARAGELGIPVVSRASMLAAITAQFDTIAISGTHGKTTTSSMMTLVLRNASWDPTFIVGGDLNEVGTNASFGASRWLVVEADESDGTFVALDSDHVLVTNMEPEHMDYFGDEAALRRAFAQFIEQASGERVLCADDGDLLEVAQQTGQSFVTYGQSATADYQLCNYRGGPAGSRFDVTRGDASWSVHLAVPGIHNALNATGVLAMADRLGVDLTAALEALARFGGVSRRFERRGRVDGVELIDDYAHHPTEVAAVLQAARERHAGRIVAVFQPHRYSRTAELGAAFGPALAGADHIVVTDVYAAGEQPIVGISGRMVADAATAAVGQGRVTYVWERRHLLDAVRALARPGDLVLTLGAGDITGLADEWMRIGTIESGVADPGTL